MTISWRTAWVIARRDLSARFRGLRLLLICLFLGVGAISAIGTLTGSIERELSSRGREILGGDVEAKVWQRQLTPRQLQALARYGTVSRGYRMQAIASKGDLTAPVALKAVDGNWPLYGRLVLEDGRKVGAPPPGMVWIARGTAARLGVKVGDSFRLGGRPVVAGGIITVDPEQMSEGFALGDVAIAPLDLPQRAGLIAPGAMYRSAVRVRFLDPRLDPDEVVDSLKQRFGDDAFDTRTRNAASPSTARFVNRMGEFLVLVGLAALVIAGIGIGGGVSSYLEARRTSIATLKVLGATSGDIARIYLLQVGAAAITGSIAGLLAGVMVTPLLAAALGSLLPVNSGFTLSVAALATAAAYGLLVALVFAAPPLVRARGFPAMALMRARVSPLATDRRALLPVGLGLAAIVALALANAAQPLVTIGFITGAGVMLGLLALVGLAIRALAARLPRPRDPMLRIGLANLHRPGAQTGALVTALGFGLAAFVLIAAVQTSLEANIRRTVPARAPDFFVLDVPRDGAVQFRETVRQTLPGADVKMVPNLRGRILAYGPRGAMTRVSELQGDLPDGAWALRGERGLTYSETVPEGSTVIAGQWWPRDYRGEPLVSLDERFAEAVGLHVGDYLTIGVLGVERTARIAALRRIDWDTLGFNFVLVFSPNALDDAPHNLAATIEVAPGTPSSDLLPRLARAFPSSSVIETGGLLRDARALLDQMATAILAAASVAVLAGLAVLLGAIAAARASRTYDNVILRVLGASRGQLLAVQLAEYGFLALLLSAIALVAGSGLAWAVVVHLFEFEWMPDWPRVFAVLATGVVLVLAFALGGSLPLLRAKPAQALREL